MLTTPIKKGGQTKFEIAEDNDTYGSQTYVSKSFALMPSAKIYVQSQIALLKIRNSKIVTYSYSAVTSLEVSQKR